MTSSLKGVMVSAHLGIRWAIAGGAALPALHGQLLCSQDSGITELQGLWMLACSVAS